MRTILHKKKLKHVEAFNGENLLKTNLSRVLLLKYNTVLIPYFFFSNWVGKKTKWAEQDFSNKNIFRLISDSKQCFSNPAKETFTYSTIKVKAKSDFESANFFRAFV